MTAARATPQEVAALVQLLQREASDPAGDDEQARVLTPLLDAALHGPLREFLSRPGKEFRARLCELGFQLSGGQPGELPPELPLSIEILHAGSLIVDDIEDDSQLRRGAPTLHRMVGLPVALNAGNWLYFWPQRLVARSGMPARARLAASERMGECLLRCHEGQALDLTVRVGQLAQADVGAAVRGCSERKTGALMGLAAALGAIAAGAGRKRIEALHRFGCELGVGLQMLDDLSGVLNPARADKGQEDLLHQRATWVWAWLARDLPGVEYGLLLQQLQRLDDRDRDAVSSQMGELIERLRFRLGVTGSRRARRQLERALHGLRDEVGDGPWRQRVEQELHWLQRRFMEGAG